MTDGQAGSMRMIGMSLTDESLELIDIDCFFPYTQLIIKRLLGWSQDLSPHIGG